MLSVIGLCKLSSYLFLCCVKRSRGFGFVAYKTSAMLDEAQLNRPHVIDKRQVETKRAMPREVNSITVLQILVLMLIKFN